MTCSQRARCSTFRFDLYTFLHDSRMHGVISPQQGLLDGVRADLDSGHGVAGLSAGRRTVNSREEEDLHRESHGGVQHDDGDDEQADGLVVTLDVSRGLDGAPYRCQDWIDVANAAASAGTSR
jgi:hypothetical protein